MLTGRFQLAAPERSCRPRPRSCCHSARARPARSARRRGPSAPTGCRRRCPPPRSATATRRRWARSTCCRRARSPVPGLDDGELGPDADDPALTLEVWRQRIGATRASSRTCSRTRHSWPASATPTATRSSTRRGCCRSGSDRPGGRGGRRAPCRDPLDARRRDRRPSQAGPADVREAGPRLPRGPRQGRPGRARDAARRSPR